jgi:hypothetical protein
VDQSEQKLLSDIREYGWHAVMIQADEKSPGWGFTVGFFHSYRHPELVITGLKAEITHQFLRLFSVPIMAGKVYKPGDKVTDIGSYPFLFVSVPTCFYRDYLGFAIWFYKPTEFPVLQVVWPDKAGRFPWEADYDTRCRQPLLFDGL